MRRDKQQLYVLLLDVYYQLNSRGDKIDEAEEEKTVHGIRELF